MKVYYKEQMEMMALPLFRNNNRTSWECLIAYDKEDVPDDARVYCTVADHGITFLVK